MGWNSTVTFNGTTYASTANLWAYAGGAFFTTTALKHVAPSPWRNIPSVVVWYTFGLLAFLPFRKVAAVNEGKDAAS